MTTGDDQSASSVLTTAADSGTGPWWDRRLFGVWLLINAIAFAVIPLAGAALEGLVGHATKDLVHGHKWLVVVIIAVVGGAFEGALLGRWQWRLLVRRMPLLRRRRWVIATLIPVFLVWLLVIGPKAVDIMAKGGSTFGTFRNGFIQALVLGPLIGLSQATALRHHTPRWAWWFPANLSTYLSGALLHRLGVWLAHQLSFSANVAFSFPVLAAVIHGMWMLWVTAPAAPHETSAPPVVAGATAPTVLHGARGAA
jgi:hypothetical protein